MTLEPADTIDTLTFRSENEAVATVSADGKITAVAKGQTKIIVTCGSITKECAVICQIEEIVDPPKPAEEIRLNRSDITFSYEGESWIVYSGTVAKNLVTFTSDNEAIVTFVDGKAVAIGPGTTSVHAEYNGQKLSCIIRCVFEGSQGGVGGNGGVGEDGDGKVTYDIYTHYGDRARDITISVNEKVYLYLKDSNGNKINVTWTSSSNACTVTDNLITGAVAWSNATVSTTYDGQTYSCIIRVVSSNG